jgi:hypothetical protein
MTSSLYLPTDAVTGRTIDFDLAADFLELAAFFSDDSTVATSDLANTASIAAAEDHADLEDEIDNGEEEIVSGAVNRLALRARIIGCSYPFVLDDGGDILGPPFRIQEPVVRYSAGDRVHRLHDRTVRRKRQSVR